jgi:hypothetical protein
MADTPATQTPQTGQMRYIKDAQGQVKRVTGTYALQNGEEDYSGSPIGKSLAMSAAPMAIGGLLGLARGATQGNALGGLAQGLAPGLAGLADTGARLIQERNPDSILGAVGAGALASAGSLGAQTMAETARRGGNAGEVIGSMAGAMLEGGVTGAVSATPGLDAFAPAISPMFNSIADMAQNSDHSYEQTNPMALEGLTRMGEAVMNTPDWGGKLGQMGGIGNVRAYAQGDYGKGSIFSQDPEIVKNAMREQNIQWQQGEEKKYNDMQKEQATQQQTLADQQKTIAGLEQKVSATGAQPGVSQTPPGTPPAPPRPPKPGEDIDQANKALINTYAGLSQDDLAGMSPMAQMDLLYLNPQDYNVDRETGLGSGKELIARDAKAVRAKLNNMRLANQNAEFYNNMKSGMNKLAGMLGIKKRFDMAPLPYEGIPQRKTPQQIRQEDFDRKQEAEQQRLAQVAQTPTEEEQAERAKREDPNTNPLYYDAVTTPDGKTTYMPRRASFATGSPSLAYSENMLHPSYRNPDGSMDPDMQNDLNEYMDRLIRGKSWSNARKYGFDIHGGEIPATKKMTEEFLLEMYGAKDQAELANADPNRHFDKENASEKFMDFATLADIPHEMYPKLAQIAIKIGRPDLTPYAIANKHQAIQDARMQADFVKQSAIQNEAKVQKGSKLRRDEMNPQSVAQPEEGEELEDIESPEVKKPGKNELPVPYEQTPPDFQKIVNSQLEKAGGSKLKQMVADFTKNPNANPNALKDIHKEWVLAQNRLAREYGIPTSRNMRFGSANTTPEYQALSPQKKYELQYVFDQLDSLTVPSSTVMSQQNLAWANDEQRRLQFGLPADYKPDNDPDDDELDRAIRQEDEEYATNAGREQQAQEFQQQQQAEQDRSDLKWTLDNEFLNSPEGQPKYFYDQNMAGYNDAMRQYNEAVRVKQEADARIAQTEQTLQTFNKNQETAISADPHLGFTRSMPNGVIETQSAENVLDKLEESEENFDRLGTDPAYRDLVDKQFNAWAYRRYQETGGDLNRMDIVAMRMYAIATNRDENYFGFLTDREEVSPEVHEKPQEPAPFKEVPRGAFPLPLSASGAFNEMPTDDLIGAKNVWATQKPKDDIGTWDDWLAQRQIDVGNYPMDEDDIDYLREVYDKQKEQYLDAFEEWRKGMVNLEEELSKRDIGQDLRGDVDPLTGRPVAVSAPRQKQAVGRASSKFMAGVKRPEEVQSNARRAMIAKELGLEEPEGTIQTSGMLEETPVKGKPAEDQYDLMARLGQTEKDAVGTGFNGEAEKALKIAEKNFSDKVTPLREKTDQTAKAIEDIEGQIKKLRSGLYPSRGSKGEMYYPKGSTVDSEGNPINATFQDVIESRRKLKELEEFLAPLREEYVKDRLAQKRTEDELNKGMEELRKAEVQRKSRANDLWQEHLDDMEEYLENAPEEEYRRESAEERLSRQMTEAERAYSSPELRAKQEEERQQALAIFGETAEATKSQLEDLKDLAQKTDEGLKKQLAQMDPNVVAQDRSDVQRELTEASIRSGRTESEQLKRMSSEFYDKHSGVFSNPVREDFEKRLKMPETQPVLKDSTGKDISSKKRYTYINPPANLDQIAGEDPQTVLKGKYSKYIYLNGLGALSIGSVDNDKHEYQAHGELYSKLAHTIIKLWNSGNPSQMEQAKELYEELPMLDRGYEDKPKVTRSGILEARRQEFENQRLDREKEEALRLESREAHKGIIDVLSQPPMASKKIRTINETRARYDKEVEDEHKRIRAKYEHDVSAYRRQQLQMPDRLLDEANQKHHERLQVVADRLDKARGRIEAEKYNLDRYNEALKKVRVNTKTGRKYVVIKDLRNIDTGDPMPQREVTMHPEEAKNKIALYNKRFTDANARFAILKGQLEGDEQRTYEQEMREVEQNLRKAEPNVALLEKQFAGNYDREIQEMRDTYGKKYEQLDRDLAEAQRFRKPKLDVDTLNHEYNRTMAQYVTIEQKTRDFPRHAQSVLDDVKDVDIENKESRLLLAEQQKLLSAYTDQETKTQEAFNTNKEHIQETQGRIDKAVSIKSGAGIQVDMLEQELSEFGGSPEEKSELEAKLNNSRTEYARFGQLEQRYRSELRQFKQLERDYINEQKGVTQDIAKYQGQVDSLGARVKQNTDVPIRKAEAVMKDAFIEMDDLVTTYNKLYEFDIEHRRRTGKYWDLGHKRIELLDERLSELDDMARQAHEVYQKYAGKQHETYEAKRGAVLWRKKSYQKDIRHRQKHKLGAFAEAPQIPGEGEGS